MMNPIKKFTELFLDALRKQNMKSIQKLYDFVIDSIGGFNIEAFKIKSKLKDK